MGPKGYSQEFVHLEEVLHLAARIRSAVEDGMTLTNTASKLARAERDTPEG
jgi:hypothetical protein